MAFSDSGSAIDDDFPAIHFGSAGDDADDNAAPPWAIRGPQSGHWSVSSSEGSAIDDRCPTVWNLGPQTSQDVSGPPHQAPLAADAVEKLVQAALRKRADQAKAEKRDALTGSVVQERTVLEKEPSRRKGFLVPKIDNLPHGGVKVVSREGQQQIIQTPRATAAPTKKAAKPEAQDVDIRTGAASPQPTIQSKRAASGKKSASRQSSTPVRIVGKSGEEAFFYIPVLRRDSSVTSRPSSKTSSKASSKRVEKSHVDDVKLQMEAQKMREERLEQERRAEAAKTAALALMSGALPATTKTSSARTRTPSVRTAAAKNPHSAQPPSPVPTRRSGATLGANGREKAPSGTPTIFAGAGWITPHPLSANTSELSQPPQSAISVQGEKMTYSDWKFIREVNEIAREEQRSTPGSSGGASRRGSRMSYKVPSIRADSVVSDRVLSMAQGMGRSSRGADKSVSGGGKTLKPHQASVSSVRESSVARSGHRSPGAASQHSSQRRRTEHTLKDTESLDWALPNTFDEAANEDEVAAEAYMQRLRGIIDQYPTAS